MAVAVSPARREGTEEGPPREGEGRSQRPHGRRVVTYPATDTRTVIAAMASGGVLPCQLQVNPARVPVWTWPALLYVHWPLCEILICPTLCPLEQDSGHRS